MHHRFRYVGLFLIAAGAVLAAGQATQPAAPQTPTFRADVEYVEVDALVTDQQGAFVRGLTQDDFEVFEDGKRQTIAAFSIVDIPVERFDRPLFASAPLEPDVQTNERPFDGRVYVMVLDDLHISPLRGQRVRAAARRFIERSFGANDRMAILFTRGRAQDAQDFTNNKRLLIAAVEKLAGDKLESATLAQQQQSFNGVNGGDPYEQERAFKARSVLTTLRQVAEWFGGIRGRRKTLMFFSEGLDYDLTDIIRSNDRPASFASGLLADMQDTLSATARSNVTIYAIDPRGLSTGGEDAIEVGGVSDTDDGGVARSLNNEERIARESLRQLAEETGGFAAINRNDFTKTFERIVGDNSSYYAMAYYPPSAKRDGKFHRIEVKVKRPGVVVRSRRGYAAPRGKPSKKVNTGGMAPEVYDAINNPLQVSGLGMRAFATPFKGAAPNASVLVGVELRGRDLGLGANTKLEVTLMAVDSKSKVFGPLNSAITMNLREETRKIVEQSGFRVLNRMDLPPGRYQVRVAARDTGKSSVGSVICDLEVPDFYKQPLTLSGVVLTSLSGGAMVTPKVDEQLKDVLPAPPVALRVFPADDELALFAEVYDNASNQPHKVEIVTKVLTDEGRELYRSEEVRDTKDLQGARGGFGYAGRIPISTLAEGMYVLSVEARARIGSQPSAVRQIQFSVAPRASRN
jgi:VWFA-related protein